MISSGVTEEAEGRLPRFMHADESDSEPRLPRVRKRPGTLRARLGRISLQVSETCGPPTQRLTERRPLCPSERCPCPHPGRGRRLARTSAAQT